MIDLTGKVALITGASRGIGYATAQKLAQYGATVVLAARSTKDIEKNVEDIRSKGGKAEFITCDVSEYENVQNAINYCVEHCGSLDILVNNAGTIDPISRIVESDHEAWSKAVDVNLKGVYYGLRAALSVMEKQGQGTIINISSGAANSALEGWSHYCATKAAVQSLTRCADNEYREKGIRVIGLSPGTVSTGMMKKIKSSGINPVSKLDWSTHIPSEWPAEAVAYLCTTDADDFLGTDFSIKTEEGRKRVGLVAG